MTEEKKSVEQIEVFVDAYPDFGGAKIETRKYSPKMVNDEGGEFKFRYDCHVPVPSSDAEAKELYNLSIGKLIEMGVRQHCYGENVITGMLADRAQSGNPMDSKGFVDKIADALKTALVWTEKESKVSKAKENADTLRQLYKLHGLDPASATPADLMNAIQAARK